MKILNNNIDIIIITVILPIIIILLLIKCILSHYCCVRRSSSDTPKEELFGMEGRMTIIISDNNISHYDDGIIVEDIDSIRNTNRRLPELPKQEQDGNKLNGGGRTNSIISHDGTSELYATVDDELYSKPIKNNITTTSQPSSESDLYHPYDTAAVGGEIQKKKIENPYAHLNNNITQDMDDIDYSYAKIKPSTSSSYSQHPPPPIAPIRIRRSHNTVESREDDEEGGVIEPRAEHQPNIHFSSDSQDSARGYMSISVREPLATIRNSIQTMTTTSSHYTTVEDDSEQMYEAIAEEEDPTIEYNRQRSREANSPLPPPPPPPTTTQQQNNLSPQQQHQLPIYAQINKNKQQQQQSQQPSCSSSSNSQQSSSSSSQQRRSRVDINYSEFDIIHESLIEDEDEEDHYNIIPDVMDVDDENYQCINETRPHHHGYEKLLHKDKVIEGGGDKTDTVVGAGGGGDDIDDIDGLYAKIDKSKKKTSLLKNNECIEYI